MLVDVVVGHLVLVGGLVGLVLVLLAGLEVVEQGLEAVTKEEAGNQGSVCLGQELSLTLLFDGGGTEDILSIYWEVTRIMCTSESEKPCQRVSNADRKVFAASS